MYMEIVVVCGVYSVGYRYRAGIVAWRISYRDYSRGTTTAYLKAMSFIVELHLRFSQGQLLGGLP